MFVFLNQVYGLKQDKVSLGCDKKNFGHFWTVDLFIHLNLDPIERPRHGKTNVRGSGQDAAKAFGVFFQAFWCPFLPVPYLHKFMWPVLGSFFGQKFKDYGGQKLEIIVLNHFDVICLPPLLIVNLIFS